MDATTTRTHRPTVTDMIRSLHSQGLRDGEIAAELVLLGYGSARYWYRVRVQRLRRKLGLRALAPRNGWHRPRRARLTRWRVHQTTQGFGHLLPHHVLTPHQSDILARLRDHGPLTSRQLAASLGLSSLPSLIRYPQRPGLANLVAIGLVLMTCQPDTKPTYSLATAARHPVTLSPALDGN